MSNDTQLKLIKRCLIRTFVKQQVLGTIIAASSIIVFGILYMQLGKNYIKFLSQATVPILISIIIIYPYKIRNYFKLIKANINESDFQKQITKLSYNSLFDASVTTFGWFVVANIVVNYISYLDTSNLNEFIVFGGFLIFSGIINFVLFYIISDFEYLKMLNSSGFYNYINVKSKIFGISLNKKIWIVTISAIMYPIGMIICTLYYMNFNQLMVTDIIWGFVTITVSSFFIAVFLSSQLSISVNNSVENLLQTSKKILQGDFEKIQYLLSSDEFSNISHSFNMLADYFGEKTKIVNQISVGDLDFNIKVNSEYDQLSKSMIVMTNTLKSLKNSILELTQNAQDGKLDVRGNKENMTGVYSEIVDGFNKTLDAIIDPISESTKVLDELSRGNLTARVKGQYKGDHAIIKNSLNLTIDSLAGYIKDISDTLNKVSTGNLDVEIKNEYQGDFIEIKNSINSVIKSFGEVLLSIRSTAQQVASNSKHVSDSAQVLSQASTEQASTIDQLNSSIEGIAGQVKQNAVNANQANELAYTAKTSAIDGDKDMKDMLNAMADISNSTKSISAIIKVVDEIAFQTNILALNAAVEAARAGKYGKGFAVVADEVRNLAAKSADAVKETTELIDISIKKTAFGMQIADKTASSFNNIVDRITKVANLIENIAVASNEQTIGIQQINVGISQVSQVVQNNSSTAEESAAASEEMNAQAEVLKEMVKQYNLKKVNSNRGVEDENEKILTINNRCL